MAIRFRYFLSLETSLRLQTPQSVALTVINFKASGQSFMIFKSCQNGALTIVYWPSLHRSTTTVNNLYTVYNIQLWQFVPWKNHWGNNKSNLYSVSNQWQLKRFEVLLNSHSLIPSILNHSLKPFCTLLIREYPCQYNSLLLLAKQVPFLVKSIILIYFTLVLILVNSITEFSAFNWPSEFFSLD